MDLVEEGEVEKIAPEVCIPTVVPTWKKYSRSRGAGHSPSQRNGDLSDKMGNGKTLQSECDSHSIKILRKQINIIQDDNREEILWWAAGEENERRRRINGDEKRQRRGKEIKTKERKREQTGEDGSNKRKRGKTTKTRSQGSWMT